MIFFLHGYRQKLKLGFLLLFLFYFSNSFIANSLIESLEKKFPPVEISSLPESDAVVVLGGMINTLGKYKGRPELTDSSDRLVDAVRIYKAGKAKKILFAGGSGILFAGEIKEADLAEKIFLDLGVAKEDLILERESKNTYENAIFSAKKIEEHNIKSLILVTSAFHSLRATACFKKANLNFVLFPTDYKSIDGNTNAFDIWMPSPHFLEISTIALKEWMGYLVYEIKGYL